jgi:hypothetical protein
MSHTTTDPTSADCGEDDDGVAVVVVVVVVVVGFVCGRREAAFRNFSASLMAL